MPTYVGVRVVAVLVRVALVLLHIFQRETAYPQRLENIQNLSRTNISKHATSVARGFFYRSRVLLERSNLMYTSRGCYGTSSATNVSIVSSTTKKRSTEKLTCMRKARPHQPANLDLSDFSATSPECGTSGILGYLV